MDQNQQHKVISFNNVARQDESHVTLVKTFQLPHSPNSQSAADEDWDRWDDGPTEVVVGAAAAKPNSVEDHIRAYREAKRRATEEAEVEEEQQVEPERDLGSIKPKL